jgi:GTP pyrophosphokinase
MTAIRMYRSENISLEQIDTFRKMLLTITEDVRIVLVKIVDKLCTVRHLKALDTEIQQTIAREALDIYAPLANRLGLSQIKWELEDRAFFFLKTDEYKKVANSLGMTRVQREEYLEKVLYQLNKSIKDNHLDVQVNGRVKHIYSIWKKLGNKGYSGLDRLFDITALRVIANNVDDCYKALAEVNDIWEPIAEEFTDYIANPKANGYKSIHTVVKAFGNPIEVQIRTNDMHEESELGFAAHWRYKEGVKFDASYEARVAWLRSLLEWEKEINQEGASVSKELEKRIYVFTPADDLIDLADGSTVLDFAYSVHTMIGHRTRGAKISGRIVPLTTKLQNGDKIEILTQKLPNPSKDWATESLGFLSSTRNRSRVTKWFHEQNKEDNVSLGRERLIKELKGYNLREVDYLEVAKRFNMQNAETLLASAENGTVRIKSVINHILDMYSIDERVVKRGAPDKHFQKTDTVKTSNILVSGHSGMKYFLAKCCDPQINDNIEGYLSVGKGGVIIHTTKCPNLSYLKEKSSEKFIKVDWEEK